MSNKSKQPLVTTVKDRCRVCYTCVRECPAKAIRIVNGQAEIIAERCIGCGNCVRVCSQKAKKVVNSIADVRNLLASADRVAAIIAPSFPAEFPEIEYRQFVGMVRALGFYYVCEVGFGADLVARKTREIMADENNDKRYISTPCPAVFGYVKRYHPELIDNLLPVVSPMVAMARAMREIYEKDLKIVFIGPCIAKKGEAYSQELDGEIDEVLTFEELGFLFEDYMISNNAKEYADNPKPSDFDPPRAYRGNLFPIGRGLLEAANINEDLMMGEVLSANGRNTFKDAIIEFSSGQTSARFLDVLCCDGCIMGPGMTTDAPLFRRRTLVSDYVRNMSKSRSPEKWIFYMEKLKDLDLSRTFSPSDQRIANPDEETIQTILAQMGKYNEEEELNCGACGYETCREHAIAIHKGLAEKEMCLPFTIERLHRTIAELGVSNTELANTREALIQSEKMASMGQLAAGIAHEINNPLGVVLMYSHLLSDEIDKKSELHEDLQMIADHADRAKKIVSGLLNFARQSKVNLKPMDIHELISESLSTLTIPETVKVERNNNLDDPIADIDRDQMIQVFTNIISNAITAMHDKGTLTIETSGDLERISVSIADTGTGIPDELVTKIFEPFFTTKPLGKGTGLGLAITYGIIKMHRGDITLKSNTDPKNGPTGTTFTVKLPRKKIEYIN